MSEVDGGKEAREVAFCLLAIFLGWMVELELTSGVPESRAERARERELRQEGMRAQERAQVEGQMVAHAASQQTESQIDRGKHKGRG